MNGKIPAGWWISAILWAVFLATAVVACIALAIHEVTS